MSISLRQRVLRYKETKKRYFWYDERGTPLYEDYFFSTREKIIYALVSLVIVLFFSFFFYRSLWAMLGLSPIGIVSYLSFQKNAGEQRQQKLETEFKDCILSVSANLRAGYSVENAFSESIQDVQALYGENSLMKKELSRMKKGISHNIPLEELLGEFGERSGSSNIMEFAEVFSIARNSGGGLSEIIQSSANLIGEKIALKQEIQVIISGRLFEQKIMDVIPFFLIVYIEFTNRGFFDVLYHNLTGICIMTGCLILYLTAYFLAGRICKKIG